MSRLLVATGWIAVIWITHFPDAEGEKKCACDRNKHVFLSLLAGIVHCCKKSISISLSMAVTNNTVAANLLNYW